MGLIKVVKPTAKFSVVVNYLWLIDNEHFKAMREAMADPELQKDPAIQAYREALEQLEVFVLNFHKQVRR